MKRGSAILILFLMLTAITLANASLINVRTLPDHKASIFVLDPAQVYGLLDSKHITASATGVVSMNCPEDKPAVNINVKITDPNGEQLMFEKFTGLSVSNDIYLQVMPGNISENYKELDDASVAAAVEEAASAANESGEQAAATETSSNESKITGLVTGLKEKLISVNEKINWTYVIYAVLVIVVIGGVVFFVMKRSSQLGKLLVVSAKGNDYSALDEKRLLKVESKLKEAEEEILAIKNKKNELTEAQKQFEEAKKRLEKLKEKAD